MENWAKTAEDRLIDTYLPLYPWLITQQLKSLGCPLNKEGRSAIARMFVPPSSVVKSDICRNASDFLSPKLHSPTWRRRLRKRSQKAVRSELRQAIRENGPVIQAVRQALAPLAACLEAIDWLGLCSTKLSDFEEQQKQRLATLGECPEVIDELFPRQEILDPRLQKGLEDEDYHVAVIELLSEFCLRGESEIKPLITKKSGIWSIFNLDFGELEKPPRGLAISKSCDAVLSFFIHYDESRGKEVLHWLMHSHLPAAIWGQGRYVDVDSLGRPIGHDLTLGDVLPDNRGEEEFDDIEDRLVRETALEDLPASQREDSKLFLEADDQGVSPEQLCSEKNRAFKTAQRNFERAIKTLESKRTRPQ